MVRIAGLDGGRIGRMHAATGKAGPGLRAAGD